MNYKIIGDSCLDLTKELKKDSKFQMVPLTLQVDNHCVIDDETFDQAAFLKLVKESPNCPKTACPSPESFKKAYECDADNVFVVTLSEHLSGTYQSAVLAKSLYEEEHGKDKNIAVLSSRSASAGELNMALKIQELCEAGFSFEDIEKKAVEYRDDMKTYFVLESLDVLKKNGRLTGLQAFFATALNIKPVMGAIEGVIVKKDQARGINKALHRMAEFAASEVKDPENKRLVIAHCNNYERACLFRKEVSELAKFKEIVITETAGVATVYASDGGIVVAV